MSPHPDWPDPLSAPVPAPPEPDPELERQVFCASCDTSYELGSVRIKDGDGAVLGTFGDLHLYLDVPRRRWWNRRRGPSEQMVRHQDRTVVRDLMAREFSPFCPNDHGLPPNLAPTDVIAVVGEAGSSKTHYLAALVQQLDQGDMGSVDIDLVARNAEAHRLLRDDAPKVFVDHQCLPLTDVVRGPFIYELTLGAGYGSGDTRIVSFYDVPGEVYRRSSDQVARATHEIHASGFIFLVDPTSVPELHLGKFKPKAAPEVVTRDIVDALAMVLRSLGDVRKGHLGRPFVITVSKADLLALSDPARRLLDDDFFVRLREQDDVGWGADDEAIRNLLWETSARGIVRAAENQFGRDNVRYSAMSACGQPATPDGVLDDPRSLLVAEPFIQVLRGLRWLRP